METPLEIDVMTAAEQLKTGAMLIDVREAHEVATCAIADSRHIPLQQIPAHLNELPRDKLILVHCHHGGRSMRVTQFLRANGFTQVSNIAGGIDTWAALIDPTLARY